MKTLKFKYAQKEYIYEIKSYGIDFSEKRFTVKIIDSKDSLFSWIKNNKDTGAKEYVMDMTITDKNDNKSGEHDFTGCSLNKFVYVPENDEYEITIAYDAMYIKMS